MDHTQILLQLQSQLINLQQEMLSTNRRVDSLEKENAKLRQQLATARNVPKIMKEIDIGKWIHTFDKKFKDHLYQNTDLEWDKDDLVKQVGSLFRHAVKQTQRKRLSINISGFFTTKSWKKENGQFYLEVKSHNFLAPKRRHIESNDDLKKFIEEWYELQQKQAREWSQYSEHNVQISKIENIDIVFNKK